jgi:hypothetical protein
MTHEHKTSNLILFLMALGAVIFHIALNGQYGSHRDELDFIMNARQLVRLPRTAQTLERDVAGDAVVSVIIP